MSNEGDDPIDPIDEDGDDQATREAAVLEGLHEADQITPMVPQGGELLHGNDRKRRAPPAVPFPAGG